MVLQTWMVFFQTVLKKICFQHIAQHIPHPLGAVAPGLLFSFVNINHPDEGASVSLHDA